MGSYVPTGLSTQDTAPTTCTPSRVEGDTPPNDLSEAASEKWQQSVLIWICGVLGTQGATSPTTGAPGVSYAEDTLTSPSLPTFARQCSSGQSTFRGNRAAEQIRTWENADVLF